MASTPAARAARWLFLLVLLLILVGSLQPFHFRHVAFASPVELVTRLRWGHPPPADLAVNVLLYVPFGLLLAWSLPARVGGALRIALPTAAGALLSLAVEVAQWFVVTRFSSLSDVAMNTAGAFLGAALAVTLTALAGWLAGLRSVRVGDDPVAALLALAWLGSFLPPWLPRLAISGWPAAWGRHLATGWPGTGPAARYFVGWLIAGALLRAVVRPGLAWPALAFIALAMLAVRFTWWSAFAGNGEAIGALAAVAAWPLAERLPERWLARALVAGSAAGIAFHTLAPFVFPGPRHEFHLLPFADLVSYGATGLNLPVVCAKGFWYGGLVWLLAGAGLAAAEAAFVGAGGLLVLECASLWGPPGSHVPTTTDPAIALAAGFVLWALGRSGGVARERPPAR